VKARVFRLHGDEHEAVQSLLPWYVNGTLDAAELERVRDHVRECAQCQADVAWQERFCSAGQVTSEPVAAHQADRGWNALARQIAAETPRRPASAAPAWLGARWWPVAFAAQSALLAALAIVWIVTPPREEPYHALGAAPVATSANVLVVFRPTATEADIRRALRSSRAQLVAGPTVTDAYLLRVDPLTAGALATLRAQGPVLRVDSLEGAAR
jgi:anti-sigma factor RsiW